MTNDMRRLTGLALAAIFACCGCARAGGAVPASSSTTRARVRGKVTRKGRPLAGAEIRLNPANIHRKTAPVAIATTGADGSYEVTTLVGENSLTLGGRVLRRDTQLQYTAKALDVKEGENTFDVPLP